jgi:hypothetical protein
MREKSVDIPANNRLRNQVMRSLTRSYAYFWFWFTPACGREGSGSS